MTRAISEDDLKVFVMSNQLADLALNEVEQRFGLDLGRSAKQPVDDADYYPQIEMEFRAEAAAMARHYEVLYALERSIRRLISETLEGTGPLEDWWSSGKVPDQILTEVEARRQRERHAGVTTRSQEPIDFTTFGELGDIIKRNWDVFGSIFSSRKALDRVLSSLNALRAPIAHCTTLAEDEALRLRLSVRDWFRLME